MSKQEERATDNGSVTLPSLTRGSPGQGVVSSDSNPFQLAQARPGVYMTEDHRYWVNGKGPYPSVTTALDVLHKPALLAWYAQQTAMAAATHLPELIGKPVEEAVALILASPGAPGQVRDKAAKVGTSVHLLAHLQGLQEMPLEAADGRSKGFEVPNEVFPYLEAFRGFLAWLHESEGGTIVSSEHAVYSETEGYCGTYDLIISLHDDLWLLDVKSSKGYYPDFGLQLSAYANAEYIVLEGDPTLYPMPQVQHTAILHLRPDAYPPPTQSAWRLVEYPTTDRDYVAFLAALELYRWKKEGRFLRSTLNKTTIHNDPKTQAT